MAWSADIMAAMVIGIDLHRCKMQRNMQRNMQR